MSHNSRSLSKIIALVVTAALLLAACAPREAAPVEETRAAAASEGTLYMEVVGMLEALGDDSATVGGTRLRVNNTTQVAEGLATNQLVEAQTVLGEDGLAALAIRQAADGQPMGQTFALSGAVENIGSSTWTVGGHTVRVESATTVSGSPAIGDLVTVQGSAAANGALVARSITPGASAAAPAGAEIEFFGVITSIGASQWVIGGQSVNVTSATEIKPGVALGANVKVHATPQTDGSLLAREIELALGNGDGTATPPAGGEQEFTGPLTTISGDLWTIGGVQVRVTGATEVKGTFQIGDVLKVHASPASDGVLVAREVELAAGDDDDNDDDDDNGNEQEFTGALSAINGDVWTVGGRQVRITSGTEVKGTLQIGDVLKVHASPGADGVLVAREVELADADDLNDDNDGDDNGNSGSGNGDDDGNDDDNSGSGNGGDDDNDNSGSGNGDDGNDDNSGSGGGGDDSNDDNSGSGNGDDDDDDNDDNSGSGGGGDDDGDDDNSGSGGGDDDD